MNFYRLITLILAILTTSAYASQSSVEIFERFDDIRIVAVINKDDIDSSPKWNPGLNPLPLSVDRAIRAIQDFVQQPRLADGIQGIEIRTFTSGWDSG